MNLNKIPNKLGVMQGRLVPQESKKIQSFPWKNWKKEIRICGKNNFKILEWTVDSQNFHRNPINLKSCRKTINNLKKKYEIIENKNVIEKVIQDLYSEIGISNIEEFKVYLSKHNVNLSTVKKKIAIEVAWNDYIVQKFNNAVLVDEAKIKDKINRLSEKNYIDNILLSEIIFTLNESENFEKKLEKIEKSINQIGFEETAKIYSVSESKKNGGKIGWVYKSQLSNKISKQIENIKVGEFTEPMTVPGGFIILKLVDKKNQLIEINEEEEFKKAVSFEKNRQLTMYSTLHYKRIYNKAVINEF